MMMQNSMKLAAKKAYNATAPKRRAAEKQLTEAEWPRLVAGLERLVALAGGEGLQVVYHHHMGTVIQRELDLDRLLASVTGLRLVLDPGHLAFAGLDPVAIARRHASRIGHVHLKSVRTEIANRVQREGWQRFTIPAGSATSSKERTS